MLRRILIYLIFTLGLNFGIYAAAQQVSASSEAIVIAPLPKGEFSAESAVIRRVAEDEWVLDEDFYFIDSLGHEWHAPAGTITDGASIPQAFLSVIGDKFHPDFLDAAVVHDAYCGWENIGGPSFQAESWEYVHYMFYEALLTNGVPEEKAKVMFTAVYIGGPRWGDGLEANGDAGWSTPGLNLQTVEDEEAKLEAQMAELEAMAEWIETENPDIEAIQAMLMEEKTP
ncbi:MAG: DUF1353 domain-containing protein [Chloroflexota bacterium]